MWYMLKNAEPNNHWWNRRFWVSWNCYRDFLSENIYEVENTTISCKFVQYCFPRTTTSFLLFKLPANTKMYFILVMHDKKEYRPMHFIKARSKVWISPYTVLVYPAFELLLSLSIFESHASNSARYSLIFNQLNHLRKKSN